MPADLERSSHDALTVLRSLRSEGAPREAAHRVAGRLALTLALPMSVLDAPAPGPTLAPSAPAAVASSALHGVVKPWLSTALWILAGAGLGAGVHGGWERMKREAPVARTAAPLVAPVMAPPPVDVVSTEPPTAHEAPSVVHRGAAESIATTKPARRAPETSGLAQERAILDAARKSWAAGDAVACLTKLDDHARLFRDGQLAEERDALRINALVAIGEHDRARQEADAFRRAHPKSFLLPSVEAAMGAIP